LKWLVHWVMLLYYAGKPTYLGRQMPKNYITLTIGPNSGFSKIGVSFMPLRVCQISRPRSGLLRTPFQPCSADKTLPQLPAVNVVL